MEPSTINSTANAASSTALSFGSLGFGSKSANSEPTKNVFGGTGFNTFSGFGTASTNPIANMAQQQKSPAGILKNATFTFGGQSFGGAQTQQPSTGFAAFGSAANTSNQLNASSQSGSLFSSFKTPQKSGK
jgi:hypothetical protein